MNVLHHPVPYTLQVLPHSLFRFFGVLLSQGLDDPSVVCQGHLHPVRHPQGGETEHANIIMESGNELNEPAGVGEENDGLVKLEILPRIALDVLLPERFPEVSQARFQLGQAGLGDLFRSQAGGQSFQVFPDEEELVYVLFRELNDEGPSLGKDLHQAFLLQTVDGLPDRSPADAQGPGQFPFVQLRPRGDLSLQNNPFQFLVSLTSQR